MVWREVTAYYSTALNLEEYIETCARFQGIKKLWNSEPAGCNKNMIYLLMKSK
jgi:hypothetical protein